MAWWRAVGGELSALGALALSMPLYLLLPQRPFDPTAPYPTPVVFVHGVCGAASNFLVLRTFLAHRGVRNFASLSYIPRVDYQRLANVRRYRSAPAFAMACGVAPIPASSGQTTRHRLNPGGNRRLNAALHTIALVQARVDGRAKAYLARKRAEGQVVA